jgi:hypothetical protein
MLKRVLAVTLATIVAVGILTSCGGGGSSNPPAPGSGSLITLIGDSPICDVGSFRVTITGLTVTAVGNTAATGVIVTTPSYAPSLKLNLGLYRDLSTVLSTNSVGAETYDKATLTLSLGQLAVYDPTQTPPVRIVTVTLKQSKPEFSISPPLTITKNAVSALKIDFDMLRSIQLDATGQVTGNVSPVFTLTPYNPVSTGQTLTQLEDLSGFIRTVTTTSTNTSFLGSFLLQLLSASPPAGPALTVNVTSSTTVNGVAPPMLDQLVTGSFLDVNGAFDSNGNFVATDIQIQDQEVPERNKVAFIGTVLSMTKDASGNLTGFDLWIRDVEPNVSFQISDDSVAAVSVSSSTIYDFASPTVNFANLTFAPSAITLGQDLIVHGTFTKPTTPAGQPAPNPPPLTTMAADKIFLKLQTMQGSFSSLVQVGSDSKTGAFQFSPCCTLLQGTPVYVLTNNQTAFVNVSGLSTLTPQHTLLIQGLPFLEPQGGTFNGVPVPAGTLVMQAKEVHQLQ